MISEVPVYVGIAFVLVTAATFLWTYQTLKAANLSSKLVRNISLGILTWLVIHGVLAIEGVYIENIKRIPPPLIFILVAVFGLMIIMFLTDWGKSFIDRLPVRELILLSVIRIPVELVLYVLYIHSTIPELMTFAGRNLDILAGLTAPLAAYLWIKKGHAIRKIALIWNLLGLALLVNIIVHALLSAPTVFQQMAFDQPNIALPQFPYIWLAAFVAPAVFFSHLVMIRRFVTRPDVKSDPIIS